MSAARLRWRCRRGTKELDILLLRFLDDKFPDLTETEQDAFESLLEQQDPDLAAWIWGGEPPPRAWRDIVAAIQAASGITPPGSRTPPGRSS